MDTTVLFVHSAGPQGMNEGSSNLIAYTEKELKDRYIFISPKMPTPEDPKYLKWKDEIGKVINTLTGGVILVGHSLGGSVLLKYLSEESWDIKISGLFIIAAPYWGIDDWQRKDFILHNKFEQQLIDIPHFFLYHSCDEEIVPFSHHIAYIEKIPQGNSRKLKGKEHLFQNGLPELIRDIRSLTRT